MCCCYSTGVCLSSSSFDCNSLVGKAHIKRIGMSSIISSSSTYSAITSLTEVLKDLHFRTRYEWVDRGVREYFSRYKWSSWVHRFVDAYPLEKNAQDDVIFVNKVGQVDNVCHRQEGSDGDFFYMYSVLIIHLHVLLPFDDFTMGVLRILNVAPTQRHPTYWAALHAFRILCKLLGMTPSPLVFYHHYSTHPKDSISWLSLFGRSKSCLLTPYTFSFKSYENKFFKVGVNPSSCSNFYNGDKPKFSFF